MSNPTRKVMIDMWYGDRIEDVDAIDITFSDADCIYRGNIYIKGKCVGDYSTKNSSLLEKKFPQLVFNWDGDSEPMDICLTDSMMDLLENKD